jgi:hypothetical protein
VEKIESPCHACKHQDGCHRTDRFSDCPERLDYLLKSSGHEPHHRGFKPDVPGFEPADPDYIATGPKIIRPYRKAKMETDRKSVLDELKEVEELAKKNKPENKKSSKSIYRECKTCFRFATSEAEIDEIFSKNPLSKDGYHKICKVCHGKNVKKGMKSKKKTKETTVDKEKTDIVGILTKTCSDCGKVYKGTEVILKNFSPHNLTEDGLFKYCKACNKIRLKKSLNKTKNENCITVDFTENMDLLDNLREMAAAAFRSPEQQVLYLISKA